MSDVARGQREREEEGGARDGREGGELCSGSGGQGLEATCGSTRGGQGEEGGDRQGRECVRDALGTMTMISIVFEQVVFRNGCGLVVALLAERHLEWMKSFARWRRGPRQCGGRGEMSRYCPIAARMGINELTVSRPSETVPTNLRIETPREAMVAGGQELMTAGSLKDTSWEKIDG